MSDVAIKVEDLGKLYRLGEVGTGTLSHDIKRWWALTRGKDDPYAKVGETNDRTKKGESEFVWALKDVSFEVKQGEVLGIIGRNGAGKSTLLKLLSKVTQPTTGNIKVKGRIASLLEVGTGFHPDLTGRENVFLNGAILGMTKREIQSKFDEIVDFAGVERYIDTPVKRYSSGMYVRLAFAVAAFLEPDILIIDEVLAVGDAEFQKKCLGRMQDVSVNDGRTVLFVSHDMYSINKITQRALFIKNGSIAKAGMTKEVVNFYLDTIGDTNLIYVTDKSQASPFIKSVELQTSLAKNVQICGDKMEVIIQLYTPKEIKNACFSFQFMDAKERNFVHSWVFDSEIPYCRAEGVYILKCTIPKLKLYKGHYFLKCYFTEPPGGEIFDIVEHICPFEVEMYNTDRQEFQWQFDTCAYLEDTNWEVKKI